MAYQPSYGWPGYFGWPYISPTNVHNHCWCLTVQVLNSGYHKKCCSCGEQKLIGLGEGNASN